MAASISIGLNVISVKCDLLLNVNEKVVVHLLRNYKFKCFFIHPFKQAFEAEQAKSGVCNKQPKQPPLFFVAKTAEERPLIVQYDGSISIQYRNSKGK